MLMQEGLQKMYFEIFGEYLWFVQESCKHTSHNFKDACLDVFLVIFISCYNACQNATDVTELGCFLIVDFKAIFW